MATQLAKEEAAQAWCDPTAKDKPIDADLAEAFADILDKIWSRPWPENASALFGLVLHPDYIGCPIVTATAKYCNGAWMCRLHVKNIIAIKETTEQAVAWLQEWGKADYIIYVNEYQPNKADKPNATEERALEWRALSDEGLRLRCGELTAQEIRTIRAVLDAILQPHQ